MERERPRASASVAPTALATSASVSSLVAPAIVPPPAALAATPSVASVIPVAPVPSVISARTHSTIVISDDEDTTVSHSPITISDDEEEEIAPVRRLPLVRPLQPTAAVASVLQQASVPSFIQPVSVIPVASVIPAASVTQTVAPSVRLVPISATQSHHQADIVQIGGAKTQQRIEFEETECRRVFRNALLCKTFTPKDEYADLNTVLYSFREVIRRQLVPILAEHRGVKVWIGLTNLYD